MSSIKYKEIIGKFRALPGPLASGKKGAKGIRSKAKRSVCSTSERVRAKAGCLSRRMHRATACASLDKRELLCYNSLTQSQKHKKCTQGANKKRRTKAAVKPFTSHSGGTAKRACKAEL